MTDKPTTEPTVSSRGFQHMDPIPSQYGGHVRVYESSNINPAIWVRVNCPANLNEPEGPEIEAVAHVGMDHARVLRDQLSYLISQHDGGTN